MTDKRFTIMVDDENITHILDNGTDIGQYNLCKLLNALNDENEQLKQFQNNTIKLIDNKIDKLQKKYEFGQKNGMCPMHNILHTINTLKELKKELEK